MPADHGTRTVRFTINGIVYPDLEVLDFTSAPRYVTPTRNPLGEDRDKMYPVLRGFDVSITFTAKQSGWLDLFAALNDLDDARAPATISIVELITFPETGTQKAHAFTGITRTAQGDSYPVGEVGTFTLSFNAENRKVIL
jgi:hypothetical protein